MFFFFTLCSLLKYKHANEEKKNLSQQFWKGEKGCVDLGTHVVEQNTHTHTQIHSFTHFFNNSKIELRVMTSVIMLLAYKHLIENF